MKRTLFVLVMCSLLSPAIVAQPDSSQKRKAVRGVVFVAPGGVTSCGCSQGTLHFGGGVDGRIKGGVEATFDVGYITPTRSLLSGIGIFSPGLAYRFNRGNKTEPFVTGGYSLFFRGGTASGVFFGGGIDRWFRENVGFRVEGRDQVIVEHNDHFVEARFAILFR